MSAFRILGFGYLLVAGAFAWAIATADRDRLADVTDRGARALHEQVDAVVQPVLTFARAWDEKFLDHPPPRVALAMLPADPNDVRTLARPAPAPDVVQQRLVDAAPAFSETALSDLSRGMIAPDLPEITEQRAAERPTQHQVARNAPPQSNFTLGPAERQAVADRLRDSLTPELLDNFGLFLFVSKAAHGPLAQRLYVFEKSANGELTMVHDWAASTGREKNEISPRGRASFTGTPRGIYGLDPERMYTRYHSQAWDQSMPFAMFFNWEREGLQTGLAIHAATGSDVAKLGDRASAGCVHISPEHAAELFDLIKKNYRGPVPRFAYDQRTQTMSNRGELMRDAKGRLKMQDGYRVLVNIEDFGGENLLAALY